MPNLPTHIAVQRLNNRAAFHLERDEYEVAIELLIEALKIWEYVEDLQEEENEEEEEDGSSSSSRSSRFSVDECILQARDLSPQVIFRRKKRKQSQEKSLENDEDDDNENQHGFIYRQPILTTKRFWKSNDIPPTNTLSLILIMNLAMAHHLCGLRTQSSSTTTSSKSKSSSTTTMNNMSRRKKILQKALQLYELAHQLQLDDECIFSPQATMIIANNVGEIHRAVNNSAKHEMCLQHLLQTMMYMVDNHHHTSASSYDSNNNKNDLWDGFLRNTCQLILQQNCAGAA